MKNRPDDPNTLDANLVSTIYGGRDGTVWIGTSVGVNRFNPDTWQFERFAIDLRANNRANHASITSLHEDTEGRLWIGTFYNGVSLLNKGALQVLNVNRSSGVKDSLNALNISDILQDNSGSVWFVTPRHGLVKLSADALAFRHHINRAVDDWQKVTMTATIDQQLWVGGGRWLHFYNPQTRHFSRVSEMSGTIRGIVQTPDQRLHVLVSGEGVVSTIKNDKVWQPLSTDPRVLDAKAMVVAADGQLWLGLAAGGLAVLDEQGKVGQVFLPDIQIKQLLALDGQLALVSDTGAVYLLDHTQQSARQVNNAGVVSAYDGGCQRTNLAGYDTRCQAAG